VFFILEVGHSNMQILATIGSIFGAIQQPEISVALQLLQ
jgi:hypothetical protein